MKKTVSIFFYAFAIFLVYSCADADVSEPDRNPSGLISLSVNGEIGEFRSTTKSSLIETTRVRWAPNDVVYVYDGSVYLGELHAPDALEDDRVATFSGTINAPEHGHTVLTFIHSNLLDSQPQVVDGKIGFDLSAQADALPFVIYGTASIDSQSVVQVTVPFRFATSAVKYAVTKLFANEAITSAKLVNINKRCVLTLGSEGNVSVEGTNPGTITKTKTGWTASSNGYAFFELGVPASPATSQTSKRSALIYQRGGGYSTSFFASESIGEGRFQSSIISVLHYPEAYDLPCERFHNVIFAPVNCGGDADNEYGTLYAWGNNTGGPEEGSADWNAGDDPCPEGWRIMSQDDLYLDDPIRYFNCSDFAVDRGEKYITYICKHFSTSAKLLSSKCYWLLDHNGNIKTSYDTETLAYQENSTIDSKYIRCVHD